MTSRVPGLCPVLLFALPGVAVGESLRPSPPTVNGAYPLWEHTGELHRSGSGQLGYHHAQLALGPAQAGTQPFLLAYGTANAQLKLALWRGERLRIALVPAWYRLPVAAEHRMIGDLHAVNVVNPYRPIHLMPLSVAASAIATRRLTVHVAATGLGQWSGAEPLDRNLSGGVAALVELRANPRWAAMLHGGAEGFPVTLQRHAGLSFAYRLAHLDLRAGYARRFEEGESSSVFLFDLALLY